MQTVEIPITLGKLDTKSDPAALPPGALTQANNVTGQTNGTYVKRNGYAAMTPCTLIDRLIASNEQILIGDRQSGNKTSVRTYRAQTATWQTLGTLPEALVTRRPYRRDQPIGALPISHRAVSGTHECLLVINNASLYYEIRDTATGATISTYTQLLNGTCRAAKVVPVGAVFKIVAALNAGNLIQVWTYNTTSHAITGPTTIAADYDSAGGGLDADVGPGGDRYVVAYGSTASHACGLMTLSAADVAYNPTLHLGTPASRVTILAVAGGATRTCVVFCDNAGNFVSFSFDNVNSSGFGPTTETPLPTTLLHVRVCAAAGTDDFAIFYEGVTAPENTRLYQYWFNTAGKTVAVPIIYGVLPASRPWASGGTIYLVVHYYDNLTNSVVSGQAQLWCLDTGASSYGANSGVRRVGTTAVGQALQLGADAQRVESDGSLALPVNSPTGQGIDILRFDLSAAGRFPSIAQRDRSVIGGGFGVVLTHASLQDINFPVFPETPTLSAGGAGGLSAGTYLYRITYERIDAAGARHISAASVPVSVVVGASGSVSIGYWDYWYDQKYVAADVYRPPVKIRIWRTAANGSVYHLLTTSDNATTLSPARRTYLDTAGDATIAANEELIYDGGELDHGAMPSTRILVQHGRALWCVPSDDPRTLAYSNEPDEAQGYWFNVAERVLTGDVGEDWTALASLDATLLAFTATRVFAITGTIPNAQGVGGALSDPQPVSSDAGCIDVRSVVVMARGVAFLSAKGMYLVDRGLQIQYIGAAVDTYTRAATACVSAVHLPDRREVRWELNTGFTLIWNYDADAWTTFTIGRTAASDALYVPALAAYVRATSVGDVWQESASLFSDDGNAYSSYLETGWIKLGPVMGLARVRKALLLCAPQDPHTMTVSVANNYVTSYTQTHDFPITTDERVSLHLLAQKLTALRFSLSDSASGASVTGAGTHYRGLALEVRGKPGHFGKLLTTTAEA